MADITFAVAGGALKNLKDMGDGTFAEVVALAATPTIDIGDVTLLASSAIVGKVIPIGVDGTTAASASNAVPVALAAPYPQGATAIIAASGNVAAAVAAATLTAAVGKTTYISGFEITGAGATAGAVVSVTVTGILGGTLTYTYSAVAGALLPNTPIIIKFAPPLPGSATNTAIVVSCPSLGLGNTNNTTVAHGYQL